MIEYVAPTEDDVTTNGEVAVLELRVRSTRDQTIDWAEDTAKTHNTLFTVLASSTRTHFLVRFVSLPNKIRELVAALRDQAVDAG